MSKKTQCPKCNSIYTITDEQHLKSGGKVRCGLCNERFTAQVLSANTLLATNFSGENQPSNEHLFNPNNQAHPRFVETPSFPVFAEKMVETEDSLQSDISVNEEPLTEPAKTTTVNLHDNGKTLTTKIKTKAGLSIEFDTGPVHVEPVINKPDTIEPTETDITDDSSLQKHPFEIEPSSKEPQLFDNSNTETQTNESQDDATQTIETYSTETHTFEATPIETNPFEAQPFEPEIYKPEPLKTQTSLEQNVDQELINKVDELIDNKLLTKANKHSDHVDKQDDDIRSDQDINSPADTDTQDDDFIIGQQSSALTRWLVRPMLSLLLILLVICLVFQLWYRQALLPVLNDKLTTLITSVSPPLNKSLDDVFGVSLPIRRDLANIKILSAKLERHPDRISTMLLRVQLLNQSKIAQPYPWLELSLTDQSGRLISRRALQPKDYLHNNRLAGNISEKELRPITIELLSFPKQTSGYQLRILNK